ncbi:MAG TPA: TauD/TfdA family dioxygenase, partial [Thermoanaerobaculia bacterium]
MQRTPFVFGAPARRTVRVSEESLVRTGPLEAGGPALPLRVEPNVEGLDAVTWAGQHRPWIEDRLAEHGALLFRGFGIDSIERFQEVARAVTPDLLDYRER